MATKATVTPPLTSLIITMATNNTTTAMTLKGPRKWVTNAVWKAILLSVEIGSSLETIFILVFNLALLLLIVSTPIMRKQMKYHLVLSLVCANLTVGIFSSPFTVDFVIRRDWIHGCYLYVVRIVLTVYVQNFVSMWGVVIQLLHYMARVLSYEGPAWLVRLPVRLQKAVPGLVVASPWIVAVVLQTPLIFLGLHPFVKVIWNEAFCPMLMQKWATYLLTILCYFLPAVILIILVIVMHVLHRDTPDSDRLHRAEIGATLVSGKEVIEGRSVHVLVAVMSVLLMGPEHVFFGTRVHLMASGQGSLIGGTVVMLLSELLSSVLPVVWLLMLPEVRARAVELAARLPCCAARCSRHGAPLERSGMSFPPVAFRDLRDE